LNIVEESHPANAAGNQHYRADTLRSSQFQSSIAWIPLNACLSKQAALDASDHTVPGGHTSPLSQVRNLNCVSTATLK